MTIQSIIPLDGPIKYGAMQAILGSDPDRSAEIRLSGWPCSNRYAVFGLVIAAADSAQDTLSSASGMRCLLFTNCRELLCGCTLHVCERVYGAISTEASGHARVMVRHWDQMGPRLRRSPARAHGHSASGWNELPSRRARGTCCSAVSRSLNSLIKKSCRASATFAAASAVSTISFASASAPLW